MEECVFVVEMPIPAGCLLRYDTELAMQIEPLKAKLATFDSRQVSMMNKCATVDAAHSQFCRSDRAGPRK